MRDAIVGYLATLIQDGTVTDHRDSRLIGFLLDYTRNAAKLEINLLVSSLKTTVPDEICNSEADNIDKLFINRMKTRLIDELGITDENAMWVVHAWISTYKDNTSRVKLTSPDTVQNPILIFHNDEQEQLLSELEALPIDNGSHRRRLEIGDRLAEIGDPRPGVGVKNGIPEIEWVPVLTNGTITIAGQTFPVKPFLIAKYPVTYIQYQAFIASDYSNPRWWNDFPKDYRTQRLSSSRVKLTNAPRDALSWYQAVAFSRWLNDKLMGLEKIYPNFILRVGSNVEVRLPTEWEWQWAAQGEGRSKKYPWGDDWRDGYANTNEAGLSRLVAVGMYPHAIADCNALDLVGNLREWCQNNYDDISVIDGYGDGKRKVLRGGAFNSHQADSVVSYRLNPFSPNYSFNYFGMRLVISDPIETLTARIFNRSPNTK
jgi:hypothetical protein